MSSYEDLMAVKAWGPFDGDEPEERNVDEGTLAPCAAEDYAEEHHADNDYPEETTVHVRCADGSVRVYSVEAEPCVTFSAAEVSAQPALPGLSK